MTGNRFSLLVLLTCQSFLIGCDGHLAESPEPGYFTLNLSLDPGQLAITRSDTLRVSFESVKFFRGPDLLQWSVIADTALVANIFEYTNGTTLALGDQNVTYLPPGNYAQLRLKVFLPDTMMTYNGRRYRSAIPPTFDAIVRIDVPVLITSGLSSGVSLIMLCDSSLTFTQGRCLFTPKFTVR